MASNHTAKVVILMVEGENDEILLEQYVDEVLQNKQTDYHFEVTVGDILGNNQHRANAENIVLAKIKEVMNTQKYKKSDIAAVFHIVDVDGSFIKHGHFLVNEELKQRNRSHEYTVEDELVYSESNDMKENNRKSWQLKHGRLRTLSTRTEIWSIPYSLIFFSITSEHVLGGEIKYDQDAKLDVIDAFLNQHPTVNDFLDFLEDQKLITQADPWSILEKSTVFKRLTNINCVIDSLKVLE